MWQLIINGPGYFDTTFDLPEGVTTLGRADENDIVLSGDLVSRRHLRIRVDGSHINVEDLASRNGSRVNGETISGAVTLNVGDSVTVGENGLSVRRPAINESVTTEMVDGREFASGVRRFGHGMDIGSAVLVARNVSESALLRVLDNVAPFHASSTPFDLDAGSSSSDLSGARPIAYDSLLLLYRVAEKLSTSTTLQAFLDETIDRLMEKVNATTAVVLLQQASGPMTSAAVRHRGTLKQGEVPVSDAVVDTALAKGAALAVADAGGDRRFATRESVIQYGVAQVLCVPIGQKAPYAGVLYLNKPAESGGDLELLLDLCTAVAHLIATGLDKFGAREAAGDDRLRKTRQRFHGPDIVAHRQRDPARFGGRPTQLEERTVTMLIAEIAGFDALASTLPAEQLLELINDFYQRATGAIFSFEGTVDKFVGGQVTALFGAPESRRDDAIRAARTALALKSEWSTGEQKAVSRELQVGLATGKVLAGVVGTLARYDFSAFGEPVTIASALCAGARPGQILITGKTLGAIGPRFDAFPIDDQKLGKSELSVAAFELTAEDVGGSTLTGEGRRLLVR